MNIFFLGDIYKINRTEFSLEREVLDFVKMEKPLQIVIHVCPLIHDSEAKRFEGKLAAGSQEYGGQPEATRGESFGVFAQWVARTAACELTAARRENRF